MRFKTIVITRKRLLLIISLIVVTAAAAAAVKFIPKRTVTVFSDGVPYEKILSEGLPDIEEKTFDLKKIAGDILGFNVNDPRTIIEEYSSVFTENKEKNIDEGENTDSTETARSTQPPAENEPTEAPESERELPDKAQICQASGLKINNATDYSVDIDALCANELPVKIDNDGPQVLVVHTHTTECYDGDQMNGETERNTDGSMNVVAVGDEICRVLEENGIKTVHDTTYHDYPSYQGSYTRALTTIENRLKENPSIKVVLDVHRDAFIYPDGSKLRVACEQNGQTAAQVMIVAGSDSMGLWHDNWRDNLTFAAKIQNAAEIMYPGLMRPVNLRTERFNEHMTKGSLILEVGSNGNTLPEAKEGARRVAYAIAAVLNAK